jgi:hypothetical protein
MRNSIKILTISIMLAGLTVFSAQTGNTDQYEPVIVSRNDLNKFIKFEAPRDINNPAKIFTKDQFIIISEKDKGIHVIDNSNPSAPVNLGFITVPGCKEIAIKGNIIYAENATDFISIDAGSNFTTPLITSRISEMFPELGPPDGSVIPYKYRKGNRPDNTVIIDWIKK